MTQLSEVPASQLKLADWARVAAQLDLLADRLEESDSYVADCYRRQAARLRAEHFAELMTELEKEEAS
jgi:hypothetical protein